MDTLLSLAGHQKCFRLGCAHVWGQRYRREASGGFRRAIFGIPKAASQFVNARQSSGALGNIAGRDGLVRVEVGQGTIEAGQLVDVPLV